MPDKNQLENFSSDFTIINASDVKNIDYKEHGMNSDAFVVFHLEKKIAIIGAGISGLFVANLFKENSDYSLSIYEKNSSIDMEEGYGIQLSTNSIKILNKIYPTTPLTVK